MTRLGAGNTLLIATTFLALGAAGCPRNDFDLGGIGAGSGGNGGSSGGSAGSAGSASGGGQRCGSRGLPECAEGFFCSYSASAQCGDADAPGVCKREPQACTLQYAPVCGCDGETYGNSCEAESNGVSVRRQGECEGSGGKVCGGLTGAQCAKDEYCNFPPDAMCGIADATGVCEARPDVCADIYKPVCGCDGKTYGNACEAAGQGVGVMSEGECGSSGGKTCGGGFVGNQCADDEYCDYPPDAICGAADGAGVCREKPTVCTREYAPVCGCDGKTYGNKCEAAGAGVSIAKQGECGTSGGGSGATCGVRGAAECPDGEYCKFTLEAQCAAADVPGKCATKPDVCDAILDEVCGCDGQTYGNECTAASSGTSVAHKGACEPAGQTCGGLSGAGCPSGQYCNYPLDAQCGAADQTGTCADIPQACTREYRPVCGCDDKTYGNACTAAAAGVAIASQGECAANGATCGGLIGAGCPDGQFCNYPIDAQCGAADQTGVCTDKPEVCTADYTPVCGCDDKTYGNACGAHTAGVSVAAQGECQ